MSHSHRQTSIDYSVELPCEQCGTYIEECKCQQRREDMAALERLVSSERYSKHASYDDACAHRALRAYGYER